MKLPLSSHFRARPSKRDALCVCLLLLAGVGYEHFLGLYFGSIPQKIQLSLAFTGSLMFGLWYEFKFGDWRGSLIRMTSITLVFLGAAYVAPLVRHEYFILIEESRHVPRVVEAFTLEGLALMANPLAGFGGCFGLSLVATRLLCGTVLVRALSWAMSHDATVNSCPHCQKAIPR